MFVMFYKFTSLYLNKRQASIALTDLLNRLLGFQASMNGYTKLWWFSMRRGDIVNTALLVSNYLCCVTAFEFTRRFLRLSATETFAGRVLRLMSGAGLIAAVLSRLCPIQPWFLELCCGLYFYHLSLSR